MTERICVLEEGRRPSDSQGIVVDGLCDMCGEVEWFQGAEAVGVCICQEDFLTLTGDLDRRNMWTILVFVSLSEQSMRWRGLKRAPG